jgi:hypothetical protein
LKTPPGIIPGPNVLTPALMWSHQQAQKQKTVWPVIPAQTVLISLDFSLQRASNISLKQKREPRIKRNPLR